MAVDWGKYIEAGANVGSDVTWPAKGEKLNKGDSIEGRYIEKKTGIGDNNSTLYILEKEDGTKVGVWGGTVLDRKFAEVAKGKMVAIEYLGEKKSEKGGRTYRDFKVGFGIDFVGDEVG